MRRLFLVCVIAVCCAPGFAQKAQKREADLYVGTLKRITDVMVNDVTSPVAASRYYAYATLAAYETLCVLDTQKLASFKGRLNKFEGVRVSRTLVASDDKLLAVQLALLKAGRYLLPSGFLFKAPIDSIAGLYTNSQTRKEEFRRLDVLTDTVVRQVVNYALADGFTRLNNLQRYTPRQGEGYWKPTPPAFMAPVEPHWNTLRPYLLDSASQFKVKEPAAYDTSRQSSFFNQMLEVYEIGKAARPEQQAVAEFWDCNPFAVQQIGHVEFGLKKISPGGHWIGITGIACRKLNYDLAATAKAHALVSFTLADAFIACWDEKYRSNRVRPETAIQQLIDPRWKPLLQTPPFPEYVSGHSVASSAAAVVLSKIFGESFRFQDDTEVEFGLPVRKYSSFRQAAAEASISRLYGGIHYRDAIDEGIWQGTKVGEWALNRLSNYFPLK